MKVTTFFLLCVAFCPAPARPAEPDALDLEFFGPKRPLLIRLHVGVDNQPYRAAFDAAWTNYLRALFRYLDRDVHGFLSPEEAPRPPAPAAILPGPWPAGADD